MTVTREDGLGFLDGEALDVGGCGLPRQGRFIDGGGLYDVLEAGLGKKLAAARGGGGKDEHGR